MKTYTRDAVNEIYLMLNEPKAYAAQALQDMRDVMHVSPAEGQKFFSGFHEAAVLAKAELSRKRAEAYRHESERLSISEVLPDAPKALQDVHDTAMSVMPPDEPLPAPASISARGIALGFALSFLFWGVIGGVLLWIRRMM